MFHSVVAEPQASAPGSRYLGSLLRLYQGTKGNFSRRKTQRQLDKFVVPSCIIVHVFIRKSTDFLGCYHLILWSPLLSPGPSLVAISARTLVLLFPQSTSHSLTPPNAPNTSLAPWKAKPWEMRWKDHSSSSGWLFCAPGSQLWTQSESDSVGEGASWCLVITA